MKDKTCCTGFNNGEDIDSIVGVRGSDKESMESTLKMINQFTVKSPSSLKGDEML